MISISRWLQCFQKAKYLDQWMCYDQAILRAMQPSLSNA